jgi:two-component system alkaline phosphatase synthesis response regulator PhoP
VEDDEGVRELLLCALKTGGFECRGFGSSEELMKAFAENIPALLVLDIMLPGEDGISILTRIKSDKKYKDVPVIMLTAKSSELDKVTGLESGADDYITKPFGVMEFLSRVKAVLRRTITETAPSEGPRLVFCKTGAQLRKTHCRVRRNPCRTDL